MSDTESELSQLAISAVLVFFGTVVGSASKLIERAILTRFLTPELYGDIDVALSVFMLTSTVTLLGLVQGVPRYVSRMDAASGRRGIWVSGGVVALTIGCLTGFGLWIAVEPMAGVLTESDEAIGLFRLLAVTVPLFAVFRIGVAAIRGHENTRFRIYTQDLLYPISRIVVITLLLAGGVGIAAVGYGYITSVALSVVATYLLLSRIEPLVGNAQVQIQKLVRFSLPLAISTVLAQLLTRTDSLMLGYFRSSREVGLYGSAYPLASTMVIILGVFGYLYLPLVSRLDSSGENERVETVYQITTRWVYILTFPVFLTFAVLPGDVIGIVFGGEYTAAGSALAILAVGFFTNAAFGRNRETLSALGTTRFVLYTNAIGFTVNLGLNLVLIPLYGYIGAAVASATSFAALNLGAYALLRRYHDVSPFSGTMIRIGITLPVILLPLAYGLSRFVSITYVTVVPFVVAVSLATLIITYYSGSTRPEDVVLVSLLEETTGIDLSWLRRRID